MSMYVPFYTFDSDEKGEIELPDSIFAVPVRDVLMAQAVRVYLANQRQGTAHTKRRSDVVGSTRKIYRQKGTGRARHGDMRAPIFVGGGVAHGPVAHSFALSLPVKMKRAALRSALSARSDRIVVIAGLREVDGKTKTVVRRFDRLVPEGSKVLVVLGDDMKRVQQALRNSSVYDPMYVMDLHTYAVLQHDMLLFAEEAIPLLSSWLGGVSNE